jgi:hypothetical protein
MQPEQSRKNIELLLEQKEKEGERITSFDLKNFCSSHEIYLLLNALAEEKLDWTVGTSIEVNGNIKWGKKITELTLDDLTKVTRTEDVGQQRKLIQIMDDLERSGFTASSPGFSRRVFQKLFDVDCLEVSVDDFRRWYDKTFPNLATHSEQPHNQSHTDAPNTPLIGWPGICKLLGRFYGKDKVDKATAIRFFKKNPHLLYRVGGNPNGDPKVFLEEIEHHYRNI